MSKPQFVLEEALKTYLGQVIHKHDDKATNSFISFNIGIFGGTKSR